MLPSRLVLSALLLCTHAFCVADIYKTVDKDGRVTYTDKPAPNSNAKPVELKSLNTTPAITPGPEYIPPNAQIDAQGYSLNLLAPENGKTLLPDERSLTISVNLNPALQNDDLLVYKLDGKELARTTETTYTFVEPPRGEHSLGVSVITREGEELAQSEAITVVVMRPLIKHPPVPVPKK